MIKIVVNMLINVEIKLTLTSGKNPNYLMQKLMKYECRKILNEFDVSKR